MFYVKLAKSNLVKSLQHYLPFMLASLILFSISCSTLLILFSPIGKSMSTGGIILGLGVVVLSLFSLIMEVYSYNILMKQRSREFGLYNVLGMNKRQVGLIASLELGIIYVLLLVFGSLFSAVFANFLYLIFVNLIHYDQLIMTYSALPFILNILIFTGIFLVLELVGLRRILKTSPLELFRKTSEGEREPRGNIILAFLGLASLGVGYYIALTSTKLSSLLVIMRFFFAVIFVIVGTYLFYISFIAWYLKWRRRNKAYYYNPRHFIPISQMLFRMKQNAVGLASITLLAVMSLVTIGTTVALYTNSQFLASSRFIKNTAITLDGITDYGDHGDLLDQVLTDKVGNKDTVTYTSSFISLPLEAETRSVTVDAQTFENLGYGNLTFTYLITQDDFRRLGNQIAELTDNQALFYGLKGESKLNSLTLFGQTFEVSNLKTAIFPELQTTYNASLLVVANAEVANQIKANFDAYMNKVATVATTYTIQVDLSQSELSKLSIKQGILTDNQGNSIGTVETRQEFLDSVYGFSGGFLFTGVLLGTSFLLGAALIIYYKQYAEGHEDRKSYRILQEVGMSRSQVKKTISSQLFLLFFMPLLLASLDYAVATPMLKQMLLTFGVMNNSMVYLVSSLTVVVIGIFYFVIYKATSRTYYKLIER
ncbi:FtsX-like permease family protein [Streptococcus loxodontisalivarius]|uniref:ABC transport system permease protein n=1 Tax=Streptococcus loxodontisalivarius TaxID=1349415 RepID=A0ABS2PQG7_9STRE|nr:ABC transporter permease [Streptococcus loxodontisalivarius]MBM7642288.1 putative ABC transport system permease protein [Streptococcus loxodontisalivarius]